jgi:deoxyadenosine/deoxycytidine kinase
MIIIEGPDAMGKTTLAYALQKALENYPTVFRIGGAPKSASVCDLVCSQNVARAGLRSSIQDRVMMISEVVYGKLFGRTLLSAKDADYWFRMLAAARPFIIYARVEDLSTIINVKEEYESQEYVDKITSLVPQLRDEYDELFKTRLLGFNVVKYDYTRDDFGKLVQQIQAHRNLL